MNKAPSFDGTQPCAQIDPELFFPEPTASAITKAKKTAEPICGSCSFQEPCLDYALHHDVQGIWAATAESDRKQIRRKRGIKNIDYMYLTIDRLTK